jgi:uncharacterized protein (UPF0335 family)
VDFTLAIYAQSRAAGASKTPRQYWRKSMQNNQLKAFVERLERLEEEKKAIQQDITEVLKEAKMDGFEPKILKKVIALRRMDPEERERVELMIATYMAAL